MSNQHVEVRSVVWKEILPWLILPRAFSVAVRPSVLLCAVVALVGSTAGWSAAGKLFLVEERNVDDGEVELILYDDIKRTTAEEVSYLSDWPVGESQLPPEFRRERSNPLRLATAADPLLHVSSYYAYPWLQLFRPAGDPKDKVNGSRTWKEFAFYLFGGLWTLLVWALFAGAITRIAALRLAREERVGLIRAITYASRNIVQYFAAPLLPLLGVLLLAILPALCGLLMRMNFVATVGGLLWFCALLFGLLITLLMLGLSFGWPLMWPAISAEGRNGDAFDSISRTYNYTFNRPLQYLFYAFVAAVIGILGWYLVGLVAEGVIYMSYWAVSLGSGGSQIQSLYAAANGADLDSGALEFGGDAVGFWVGVVRAFANAFAFSFFWCSATAIYLLLRRDVDQAEIEAVEGSDEMPTSPLPDWDQRPDPRGG